MNSLWNAMARLAGIVQGVVVQMTTKTFSPLSFGRTAEKSEIIGNLT